MPLAKEPYQSSLESTGKECNVPKLEYGYW